VERGKVERVFKVEMKLSVKRERQLKNVRSHLANGKLASMTSFLPGFTRLNLL
jgi:hypothetical protein